MEGEEVEAYLENSRKERIIPAYGPQLTNSITFVFHIEDVTQESAGEYTCVATKLAGQSKRVATVTVYGKKTYGKRKGYKMLRSPVK